MIQDKKDVFRVEQGVQIDGHTSMLIVECSLNRAKATYAISFKLNTKQVHPTEDQVNDATLAVVVDMYRDVIREAEKRRKEILHEIQEAGRDPNQSEMQFPSQADDDLPFGGVKGAADDDPEGSFKDDNTPMPPFELDENLSRTEQLKAKKDYVLEFIERMPEDDPKEVGAREIARRIGHDKLNNQFVGRVLKELDDAVENWKRPQ